MRILLVDDDDGVRDVCVDVLGSEGHEVLVARNGREALDLLRRAPRPALIFLDLMMPQMDGFEFRARQLADPAIADVPVVVLTAGTMTDRIRELRTAGCLMKPFNLDEMLKAIASFEPRGELASSASAGESPCSAPTLDNPDRPATAEPATTPMP